MNKFNGSTAMFGIFVVLLLGWLFGWNIIGR